MSRAHLTALVATLFVGAVAPRLAAQDTSSTTRRARPDTSAYTGAGGIDTSASPGRVGAMDTLRGGAADTAGLPPSVGDSAGFDSTRVGQETPTKPRKEKPRLREEADTAGAPGPSGQGSTGAAGTSDTSGMRGRHPDTTKVGQTTSPRSAGADTGSRSQ
jgi:hypothetical protein